MSECSNHDLSFLRDFYFCVGDETLTKGFSGKK